jgi:hypothetical protein
VATVLAAFVFVALVSVDLFISDTGLYSSVTRQDETSALSEKALEEAEEPLATEENQKPVVGRIEAEGEAALALPAEEAAVEESVEIEAETVVTEAEVEAALPESTSAAFAPEEEPAAEAPLPAAEEVVAEGAEAEEPTEERAVEEEGVSTEDATTYLESGGAADALNGTSAAALPALPRATGEAEDQLEAGADLESALEEEVVGSPTTLGFMGTPDQLETRAFVSPTDEAIVGTVGPDFLAQEFDDGSIPEKERSQLEAESRAAEEPSIEISPLRIAEILLGFSVLFLIVTTLLVRRRRQRA